MLILNFRTDTEAFEPNPAPEIRRVLAIVADDIQGGWHVGTIADLNGNHIGEWSLAHG